MLTPSLAVLVLWIHVIAASVWIGGQLTVAAVMPLLRSQPALMTSLGRRYQLIAWPAYALLVLTGIGNMLHLHLGLADLFSDPVGRTLTTKLGFVLLSGLAAGVHEWSSRLGPSARRSAILGSVSFLAALLAALYGVTIHGA